MRDVVYVYKHHTDSQELRYSLRSLTNLPHRRVWFVGDRPPWAVNVGHIPRPHTGRDLPDIISLHIAAAVHHPDVADEFYLFNDDMFVTAPVDIVPLYDLGPLFVAMADRNDSLAVSERHTGYRLVEAGVQVPLSYAVHTPMPLSKGEWLPVPVGCRPRSWLGNHRRVERWDGTIDGDVKVRTLEDGLPDWLPFVSTYETSFRKGEVGRQIRGLFPEGSPYEG